MARPTLYLRPLNGLGNRMRAVASGRALAKATGARLVVLWDVNDDLGACYEDLFIHDDAFEVVNVAPRQSRRDAALFLLYSDLKRFRGIPTGWIPRLIFGRGILNYVRPETHAPAELERQVRENPRTLLSSWWAFYGEPGLDYAFFQPHPAEMREIEAVSSRFGSNAVGVHIRRADNANAIRYSPLSAFIGAMRQAVAADPDVRFFLTTDDAATQDEIVALFGERVVTRERRTARDSLDGMRDAIVDLYALSRTRRILGSYYSTFSETAASIGGVGWVTVTSDPALVGQCNTEVLVVDATESAC